MRVRDGNSLETTSLLDGCHRLFIEQADTIPENISLGSLYKQCPLPYGKSRLSADTCQVGFVLLESVMKTVLLHGGKSCPLLPIKPNILALIATNATVLGARCALSKLSSACCTNPVVHVASLLLFFHLAKLWLLPNASALLLPRVVLSPHPSQLVYTIITQMATHHV